MFQMAKPAYETLYESLRHKIIAGDYPYGSKLPGKRFLAEQNGISVITVVHALELLTDEGYISAKERSGCYVVYHASDDYQGQKSEILLSSFPEPQRSSVDMDGFPFSVLARTMRSVLSEHGERILLKSPNQGILPLRQAISHYLARSRGIIAEPEQIVIGAGAEYLYGLLVDLFAGENRIWAIESPSYEKIEQVYSARNIMLERLPLTHDGIQTAVLRKTKASVLHISPYRSFPSDVTASASKRSEYLRWAGQAGRIIIEDDYESEFSLQNKPLPTLFTQSDQDNIIYLNTFSRTISSALRAGYMVLPRHLLPLFQTRAGFYSCTVPAFEQYVLTELINSGDFERHLRRVRRKLRAALGPKSDLKKSDSRFGS